MQTAEAAKLRAAWAAKGGPPCEHENTDQEFYLGSRTGDRVCLSCGEVL